MRVHLECHTAISSVAPGFRKITVIGKDEDGNQLKTVTEIVTVTPGSHINLSLQLPEVRAENCFTVDFGSKYSQMKYFKQESGAKIFPCPTDDRYYFN